jgi:hypothetical protein
MKRKLVKLYNSEYYDEQNEGSKRSAKAILGILYRIYHPNSVVDFGCGRGVWLSVAESLGSQILQGLDGPWVEERMLVCKNMQFTSTNLTEEINLDKRFDLAISVEVAEHLPESLASSFVRKICSASNIVVFGAGIKFQGGVNHINEQYQSYWIDLFHLQGYECFDIFRSEIWENEEVEWWYRQNTFLFVNTMAIGKQIDIQQLKTMERPIYNIAHPINYESKIKYITTGSAVPGRKKTKRAIANMFQQAITPPFFWALINRFKKS